MASFNCAVSFKKSPSSKMPRIEWERSSVLHETYEDFINYVITDVKKGYPKACELEFTHPEYTPPLYSAIECSPDFWGTAGY